ncbi:ribosome-binding factor A, partial [Patescibacteria group bacterium]|nr:ribosome-binding factor A [Patescibacteria group bacterium]
MSKRIQRVNALIKRELSQLILKELDFPVDILVTLTRVETTSDLRDTNVWISIIPDEKNKKIIEILDKNIYFLQKKLNKRLKMRLLPKIKFLEETKTKEAVGRDKEDRTPRPQIVFFCVVRGQKTQRT